MKSALRWTAVVTALAILAYVWATLDATPTSSAAMPEERPRTELAPSRDALSPTNATAPSQDSRAAPQGRSEAASLATETEAVQETAGTALIRVRAFAKESGAALVGRTIVARPHGASTWSTSTTKLSRAAVGEAPTTDEHGRAELTVSARTAHTLSFLERMSSAGVDVPALEPGETYEVDLGLAMETDLTFVGRVIDAETRAPIAGVSVRPEADGRSGSTPSGDTAQSDEQGYFEIRLKSWEVRFLGIETSDYPWVVVAAQAGHATRLEAFEIPLSRGATAEVRVRASGRPIAGASVRLSTKSYHLQVRRDLQSMYYRSQDPSWSATTDASGLARISGLPARVPLLLRVANQGEEHLEPNPVTLEPSGTRQLEIDIGRGTTITGRIQTSAGDAVGNAEIWRVVAQSPGPTLLSPHSDVAATTRSDANGRFVFEAVAAGDWWIGAAPRRGEQAPDALAPFAEHVALRGDEATLEITLRTDVGLYIRGKVLDPDGKPTDSAVSATNVANGLWAYSNCDADSGFSIGPLLQAEYTVVAGGFGGSGAKSAPLNVPAGRSDVVLQLERAGALVVRIAPVGGERVEAELLLARTGVEYGWSKTSTRQGEREYDGLAPGVYSICATTTDGLFALRTGIAVTAEGPAAEIELVLERGAVLELRYEGPDRVCNCSLYSNGTIVGGSGFERGTIETMAAPAGTVELRRRTGADTPPEVLVLTLTPGERRELVLGK